MMAAALSLNITKQQLAVASVLVYRRVAEAERGAADYSLLWNDHQVLILIAILVGFVVFRMYLFALLTAYDDCCDMILLKCGIVYVCIKYSLSVLIAIRVGT